MERIRASVAAGQDLAEACASVPISLPTYYRWKRAGIGPPEALVSASDLARAAILRAGKRAFLRDGFQVKLETIAQDAGVARQTLYNQFENKETLFKQIVLDVQSGLASRTLQFNLTQSLRDVLIAHARAISRVVLDPGAIALFRVALAEFRSQPELGRISYELRTAHAVPKFTDLLAKYLAQKMTEGVVPRGDAELLAESYLSAVMGYDRHRLLAGINPGPPARLEARIQLVTDIFVAALTPAQT
jgi:TetR/AcrR family transcriptional regulator, mexJK operon transcriptional repressor